jgi:hypothetical protein
MGNASNLAATLLLFGAVMGTSPAQAQGLPADGAYERLSDGNQKIARALYDAQVVKPTTTTAPTTSKTTSTFKPLTLDQIAAMKQSGQGWGQVFRSLKSQGLIQEKNLGEIVSHASHVSTPGVVTTAANRAYPVTRPAHAIGHREDLAAASPATSNAGGNGHGGAELAGYAAHGNSGGFGHGGGAAK